MGPAESKALDEVKLLHRPYKVCRREAGEKMKESLDSILGFLSDHDRSSKSYSFVIQYGRVWQSQI